MEQLNQLTKEEAEALVAWSRMPAMRIFVEKVLKGREWHARQELLRATSDKELLERATRWQLFALSLEDFQEIPVLIERNLAESQRLDLTTEEGLLAVQSPYDVA